MTLIQIRNQDTSYWETIYTFPEISQYLWLFGFIPYSWYWIKSPKQCCLEAVQQAKWIKGEVRVKCKGYIMWKDGFWQHELDVLDRSGE